MEVGGEWFINRMNKNTHPTRRIKWIKTEKIREDRIKEKTMKAKNHWNDRKFQLHWKNIEWANPKKKALTIIHYVL